MGLTYTGFNKKKTVKFDVNISGAQLLGWLHKSANIPGTKTPYEDNPYYSYIPYKASKKKAIDMGERLAKLTDEERLAIFVPEVKCLYEGDGEDWLLFIEEWIFFLLECGGYEAI